MHTLSQLLPEGGLESELDPANEVPVFVFEEDCVVDKAEVVPGTAAEAESAAAEDTAYGEYFAAENIANDYDRPVAAYYVGVASILVDVEKAIVAVLRVVATVDEVEVVWNAAYCYAESDYAAGA